MSDSRIKVLLVDDALVVRHLVTTELNKHPDLEVLPAASSGRTALQRIPAATPDVVILDIEMPDLDGLQTLREIRKISRDLPVIMFSTLTEHGAAVTLEALDLGANDFVAKPGSANNTAGQGGRICQELADKARALARERRPAASIGGASGRFAMRPAAQPIPMAAAPTLPSVGSAEAVVIGVSTGGPNALDELVRGLHSAFPVPILIVQHMPPLFTRLLAERLGRNTQVPVAEARQGDVVVPGKIWIAPGDYHMLLRRQNGRVRIHTNQAPRENSCRPSVDVLFRSAAEVYGARLLAVVMTGMGQDGLKGCEIIRSRGGHVIVQDEPTSVVWGMPGFVARAGLAESIVPLPGLAGEIMRRIRRIPTARIREASRGSV